MKHNAMATIDCQGANQFRCAGDHDNHRGGTGWPLASFKIRVVWDAAHNFAREEKDHDEDRLA